MFKLHIVSKGFNLSFSYATLELAEAKQTAYLKLFPDCTVSIAKG